MSRDALVIVGPTASGKSALAVEVALRIGGEVISLDSRQVYREMDIGTAKPSVADRRGVRHHGFDLVGPAERFNAGRFAALAREWMRGIRDRGHVPILAGGTGFFLRALTHPMFEEPPSDAVRREAWKAYLRDLPAPALALWAAALDPGHSVRPADRQRLSRIIEIAMLTGRPLSWWQLHAPVPPPAIDPLVFVLDLPRDVLTRRIDERADAMIEGGLAGEVRRLIQAGYTDRDPGLNSTGYIELVPYVRGQRTLEEAVDLIRAATRQLARRQMTWLRHQLPDDAIWLDGTAALAGLADGIAHRWSEEEPPPRGAAPDVRTEEKS